MGQSRRYFKLSLWKSNEFFFPFQETSTNSEWDKIIEKHMASHEKILAEGGTGMGQVTSGHVWTLPGCVLFAVSLITTLGINIF